MVLLVWLGLAFAGAEDLLREGRLQEAIPVARAELDAHPQHVEAGERWLDLLTTLGLGDVAVAEAQRGVVARPGSADANYLLGRALPSADLSRRAYERALELDPRHARATMGLGSLARAANDPTTADAKFSAAVKLDPSLIEAWQGLVAARLMSARPDLAIETARANISANPTAAEGYLTLSVLDAGHAVSLLEAASVKVKGDPRIFAALAEARLRNGDAAGARTAVNAALKLDPGRAEAVRVAWVLSSIEAGKLPVSAWAALDDVQRLQRSDRGAARAKLTALVAASPSSVVPLVRRARLFSDTGEQALAGADLQAALKLDPTDAETQADVGRWLLANGRAQDAKRWLEAASLARPWDAGLALAAGTAAVGAGDAAWAAPFLVAAVNRFPYDAQLALAAANALSKLGDREGAYRTLSAASRRLPDGRLVVALAAAAKDAGRYAEAADIVEALAARLDRPSLRELAAKLRAQAAGQAPK
jgi:tetratricopeptide (TPR) repeat protein